MKAEENVAAPRPKLPASFADVPRTPELEAALQTLPAGNFEMLDYKMGVLSRLDACVAGVALKGEIHTRITYDQPNADNTEATPVEVTLLDSTLPRDLDELVLSCLEQSLLGHTRRFAAGRAKFPATGGYGIIFPLENDSVFHFAKTGKWPFKLAE